MSGERPPNDANDSGGQGQNRNQGQGQGQGRSQRQGQRQGQGQGPDQRSQTPGPAQQGGPQQGRPQQSGPPQSGPGQGQDRGQGQSQRQEAAGGGAGGETAVDQAAGVTDYDLSEWLSKEPGEEIAWVGEPTKLRLVGTAVTGVVLIPFLIGILILLLLPVSYVSIKHTDYVVTNRSLYVKKGILSTNVESVDLDRIQNTEFTQSFWGKQLGFGTIEVSTAGSSGADISFSGVEDAREVRDVITRVQREFGEGDRGQDGTGGGGRTSTSASDARVDELVSELRATREALERVAAKLDEGDAGEWADEADGEPADPGVDPADHRTSLDTESSNGDDR